MAGCGCATEPEAKTGDRSWSLYWNYFVSTRKGAKFMLVIISNSVPAPLP